MLTQAGDFVDPSLCELPGGHGAEVLQSYDPLLEPEAAAREDAEFAAYPFSPAADCFVGRIFPVCGGRVAR